MDARMASFKLPSLKTALFLFTISDATQRKGTNKESKFDALLALTTPKVRAISKSNKAGFTKFSGIDFRNMESFETLKLKSPAFKSSSLNKNRFSEFTFPVLIN